MTPESLALLCAPFVVLIFGFIGKVLFFDFRSLTARVEHSEKEKIQMTVELNDAKAEVEDLKTDVKALGAQQIRHDEQIKSANNTMDEMKADLKDINSKIDILIQRK